MVEDRRVLIIDDEEDIREVARASLELVRGWQVITAASGRDGIAAARTQAPDAILLDVMMPDLDGPATLQALRGDPTTAHIPVVFLTAKVQAAERRNLLGLGATALIAKPFDPLGLADELARLLGW